MIYISPLQDPIFRELAEDIFAYVVQDPDNMEHIQAWLRSMRPGVNLHLVEKELSIERSHRKPKR
jgi:hypothetical protein